FAGSIVKTKTFFPSCAANTANEAATVVFPTPPLPTQTRICVSLKMAKFILKPPQFFLLTARADLPRLTELFSSGSEKFFPYRSFPSDELFVLINISQNDRGRSFPARPPATRSRSQER